MLFALPAFCVSVRGYFFGGRVNAAPLLLSSFLLFVNVAVMVLTWWHYLGPLIPAGQLCCVELQELSNHKWTAYIILNIMIFVVAFLLDGIVCWLAFRFAKKKHSA